MVRFHIKLGRKISLLPPPAFTDDKTCEKCKKPFNSKENRRASYRVCGHIVCLECIFAMENGCVDCVNHVPIVSDVGSLSKWGTCEDREESCERNNMNNTAHLDSQNIPLIDITMANERPVIDQGKDERVYAQETSTLVPNIVPKWKLEYSDCQNIYKTKFVLGIDTLQSTPFLETPPTTPEEKTFSTEWSKPTTPVVMKKNVNGQEPRRSLRKGARNQSFLHYPRNSVGFGRFFCKYCNSTGFIDKSSLGRHLYQEHWDIRPFPCAICDWPFESQRSLDKHMNIHRRHESTFKSKIDDADVIEIQTMEKHPQGIQPDTLEKPKTHGENLLLQKPKNIYDIPFLAFKINMRVTLL